MSGHLRLPRDVLVQPRLTGQLGVEGRHDKVPLLQDDRMSLVPGEHFHVRPHVLNDRGPDEHRPHRMLDPVHLDIRLEGVDLPAVRVPAHGDVDERQQRLARFDPLGHHDHAGAGPEHRHPVGGPIADRSHQAGTRGELPDGGRLPARDHQQVDRRDAEAGEHVRVLPEITLEREDAALHGRPMAESGYQPRTWRSPSSPSSLMSRPCIGSPRPFDTLVRTSGSLKWVVASTMARARTPGSSDLKMPEPTNTPSTPSCIISAASAGVARPPAAKFTTGNLPAAATSRTSSTGAPSSLAAETYCSGRRLWSQPVWRSIVRWCRTASTTLPVPASPLVRIMAAPSASRRRASPRSRAPQTNGTVNAHLSMWCSSSAGVSTSLSST